MISNVHSHSRWCRHGRGTLEEYVKDKNADWGGVASRNGLGEYWIACNELLWNLPWWNDQDERMNKFNEQFGKYVEFRSASCSSIP